MSTYIRFLLLLTCYPLMGCNHTESLYQQGRNDSPKNNLQTAQSVKKELSEKELSEYDAAVRAEQFVRMNGYTKLPVVKDGAKPAYESLDVSNPSEAFKERYDTLEPYAYSIRKDEKGWTVIFRFSSTNKTYREAIPDFDQYRDKYGRAVTFDLYGNRIRMEHQGITLNSGKPITILESK